MRKINLFIIMVLLSCVSVAQTGWTVYDADVLPHEFDPAFDSSNVSGDFSWVVVDDPDNADNQLLEVKSVDASGSGFFRNRFDEGNPPKGVTVVARGKLVEDVEDVRAFEIDVHLSPFRDQLRIQSDKIVLQRSDTAVSAADLPGWNPIEMNTYRISLNGSTGEVNVYLNEDPSPILTVEAGGSDNHYFRVGDGSSGSLYSSLIDYVAWDTRGAFSPESSPLPVQLGDWSSYQANITPQEAGAGISNSVVPTDYTGSHQEDDMVPEEQGQEIIDGNAAYKLAFAGEPHQSFYWRMNNIGVTDDAITIVLRAKGIEGFDRVLDLDMDNGEFRDRFVVNANGTARLWYSTDEVISDAFELPAGVDVYDWNTYRITKDGDQVTLYMNEDPNPVVTSTSDEASGTDDHFRIGDGDSGKSTGFHLDWMTWNVNEATPPAEIEAAEAHIIFITDDNKDDEQVEFLRLQGFDVDKFWPGALSEAGQDTIDMLNSADLVIIGRSPGSGTFETPDKEFWNALTVPILSNNQYGSRSNRINWFNSTTAFHANEGPDPFNAFVELPNDPIFSTVDLTAEDSIDLFVPPHDFLTLGEGSNAEVVASHDSIVVIARFDADVEFYTGSEDMPAGPRTYFGFGNDNTDVVNYFPLTDNGKAVYLAEIQRMLGHSVTSPKEAEGTIVFVHNPENIDESNNGDEPRDQPFIDKLFDEGYLVKERYEADFFVLTEEQLAEYNEADLVIIGRSGNSGHFKDNNKQAWNRLPSPVMLMSPFAARSSRLDWFESTNVTSDGLSFSLDSVVQAVVVDPTDPAFAGVDIPAEGNIDWFTGPYRALYVHDSVKDVSNSDILVVIENNPSGAPTDNALLMARFDAGEAFYTGTESKGGGPRSYFGLGHDDTTYYNLSAEAEQIWLNEVAHLVSLEYTPTEIASANSALAALNVDGALVGGFEPLTLHYEVKVEDETVPEVTADPLNEGAEVTITPADEVPGETVVNVTAADGVSALTYTINWTTDSGGGDEHKVVFVGNAGADASGVSDQLIIDTLEERGFSVDYVDHEAYATFDHSGYALTVLSESVSSSNVAPFKTAGYPTPVLIAEPYGLSEDRLNLGSLNSETAQQAVVETMTILDEDHALTKGVWAANEDVRVFDNAKTTWDVYQYEVQIDASLDFTALGQGDGYTGYSWVAIEPSGVLNHRAVVMAFHDGVATAGTDDYWRMLRRSTLWLLDSLGDPQPPTSATLDYTLNVYPNPSSEITSVEYLLENEGNVAINLLNLNGQLVSTIDSGFKKAGKNVSKFNAAELAPGLYILRVQGEGILKTRKIFINQ